MFLISDVIELAIQIERNAEIIYRDAQRKMTDSTLRLVLQWLAEEERNHTRRFANLKKNLGTHDALSEFEEIGQALLSEVLGNQSFSLKDADFSEIYQPDQLLRLVVEFESDKMTFYEMLAQFVDDKITLKFLDTMITEEKRHIQRLQRYIDCSTAHEAYNLADNVQ